MKRNFRSRQISTIFPLHYWGHHRHRSNQFLQSQNKSYMIKLQSNLHRDSTKATSKYMWHNLKDFSTENSLIKFYISINLLYKLKQVSHIWYLFLCGVIIGLGFVQLETDSCIYIRNDIIAEVYVDDIKIVDPTIAKWSYYGKMRGSL